ncbi:unnamed protein product, partial [Aphanomyces euteiches]
LVERRPVLLQVSLVSRITNLVLQSLVWLPALWPVPDMVLTRAGKREPSWEESSTRKSAGKQAVSKKNSRERKAVENCFPTLSFV